MTKTAAIKTEVAKLLKRKSPLTYQQIADKVRAKFPEAQTSVKTVQWYACRLRRDEGEEVRVRLDGRRERRNWKTRPEVKPGAQK